ncbi:MAG TPA: glycerol-3-phosphate 1-O-acyltransferase PlsY [Longimicrobiales bacterium]
MNVIFLVASYLLGAVPSSYLAGRWTRGVDLRRLGSGNLGATNAFRVLGWRIALPVLLFDMFKGWFPVFFFPQWDGAGPAWALAYGAAALVGHVFSIYVRFRGGKGVATGAGVLLALAPRAVLAGLAVWVVLVAATRIVSVASLAAAIVVPIVVRLTRGPDTVFWLSVGLAIFVVYAHRSNIRRLLRGEERRIGGRMGEAR